MLISVAFRKDALPTPYIESLMHAIDSQTRRMRK